MRAIDPELNARLASGATFLCRCWRVTRRDGLTLGFTDHDQDLQFDGSLFRASTGMNASAVQATTGLAVDNAEAQGALSDAGINDDDVRAGRFDEAKVEHWLVDWSRPDLKVLLFVGHFGEIQRAGGAFKVELRGLTEALNAPIGRSLHRGCDRRLGDAKCGFDLAKPGFSGEGEVILAEAGADFKAIGLRNFPTGWFRGGMLHWLSGANSGDKAQVKSDLRGASDLRAVSLWKEAHAPIRSGDRFRIEAGCDKQMETCRDKFSNLLNFRGFPHIPGDDWVAAYPKRGEIHDGSSRNGA